VVADLDTPRKSARFFQPPDVHVRKREKTAALG
jgi:hypothetical protein